jgi:hypothetical protein
MLKAFVLALCCAACVVALSSQARSSGPADRDSDSDDVYAAVINWMIAHPGEGPKAKQLVFVDTTIQYSCLLEKREDCPNAVRRELRSVFGQELDSDLLTAYLDQNKERAPLPRSISMDLSESWLSDADQEAIFRNKNQDGWQSFYTKYPGAGGIMAFSRVGFNKRADRALLYSTISCGWLCGTGYYHLLEKESGKWLVLKSFMAWIS